MYQQGFLAFLLALGSYNVGFGQAHLLAPPDSEEAEHAVTFDMGSNTPAIGVSYHHHIIRFAKAHQPYTRALELSAGLGFIPTLCILGPCAESGRLSTHHALLLLWGRQLQAEVGYTGFLVSKGAYDNQIYRTGAVAGLRFSPKTWLLRLYIMGMIYQEKGTAITSSGDFVWQKKT